MLNLNVRLQESVIREDNKITYRLWYENDLYTLTVNCDGKFHNKLYECDREIPQELVGFVDTIIKRETEKEMH